jgi:DNA polymerase III subunit delta
MSASSLLLLYGNDEFAIARRLNEIQALHDKDGMNTARFEARLVGMEELNSAVNAMPFLGEKRLVFLSNPSGRTSVSAERQKFIDYLLAAPPSTLVVLHELLEPRDISKHWLVKRAEKDKITSEACMLPGPKSMPGWIVSEAKRQGGEIAADAAAQLAEMVGVESRVAAQELTKLLTYVDYKRPINAADVQAVSIVSAQGDIFAFVDALGQRNGKNAQKVLHRLLETEDANALWGMVIRQFRLLLQAREIMDKGGNRFTLQESLKVHEFVAGKLLEQAAHFSLPALESIHHRLLEMDVAEKTSQAPLDMALDILVVELTRGSLVHELAP